MTKRPAIIVDGDDTLWDTQSLYDDAKSQLVDVLREYGLGSAEVLETLAEIDVGNIERYGLSRRRFPTSLRQTIQTLAAGAEIKDASLLDRAEEIGESVFRRRANLHPDATSFLTDFTGTYRLILFSAGDEVVQNRRIADSELAHLFDDIIITPMKTRERWSALIETCGLPRGGAWSVGNSVRSDINPAIALSLRAVLVVRNTWQYEMEEVLPGPAWRVASLEEAAAVIRRQESGLEASS